MELQTCCLLVCRHAQVRNVNTNIHPQAIQRLTVYQSKLGPQHAMLDAAGDAESAEALIHGLVALFVADTLDGEKFQDSHMHASGLDIPHD